MCLCLYFGTIMSILQTEKSVSLAINRRFSQQKACTSKIGLLYFPWMTLPTGGCVSRLCREPGESQSKVGQSTRRRNSL